MPATRRQLKSWDRQVNNMFQRIHALVEKVRNVTGDYDDPIAEELINATLTLMDAHGFKRVGTYILASEPGTSLTGAGRRLIGGAGGGSWSRQDRPRVDTHPTQRKLLFQVEGGS